ncbi:MAG: hypothetical protein RBT25_10210 [Lentisphaeria bacterium]|nr:hypothetical protein [Lentisphaeria bacterium]
MTSWKELLAVLVPLAALLLLGMRQLNSANPAFSLICAEHLRHVRNAAAQYEMEHDGGFPPVIANETGRRWKYWPEYIAAYMKDYRYFSCPANKRRGLGETLLKEDDLLPFMFALSNVSYGMNYFLGACVSNNDRYPYNVKRVADPAYLVYFGDAMTLELRPTSCWHQDYAPVHEGQLSNFVFVDGHVEGLGRAEIGLFAPVKDWRTDQKRWINWTAK